LKGIKNLDSVADTGSQVDSREPEPKRPIQDLKRRRTMHDMNSSTKEGRGEGKIISGGKCRNRGSSSARNRAGVLRGGKGRAFWKRFNHIIFAEGGRMKKTWGSGEGRSGGEGGRPTSGSKGRRDLPKTRGEVETLSPTIIELGGIRRPL